MKINFTVLKIKKWVELKAHECSNTDLYCLQIDQFHVHISGAQRVTIDEHIGSLNFESIAGDLL